jgi:hypothetical protein
MQVIPVANFEQPHPFSVGQLFQGGLIGFVTGSFPNQQAIIVTLDWIGERRWGTSGVDVAGTSYDLFTGATNTNLIIASEPDFDSAAKLAKNYNGDGYTDWCLPSAADLQAICENRAAGLLGDANWNALKSSWTSTQYSTSFPYHTSIRDGVTCTTSRITWNKNALLLVRPVRYVTYNGNIQQQ